MFTMDVVEWEGNLCRRFGVAVFGWKARKPVAAFKKPARRGCCSFISVKMEREERSAVFTMGKGRAGRTRCSVHTLFGSIVSGDGQRLWVLKRHFEFPRYTAYLHCVDRRRHNCHQHSDQQ
ncbi:hypothetical protein T03_3881 [Trichinella britovi]|uniref:Uncharacterized protein n=2 Tax=Trichinella TaxID=6333 RepID=A0A0V1CK18_TRIBR|nr:hypothetical protein T05_12254 [Trichinella murrelli]KRY49647.1 hypothetical protein T03_3881 [Trichinella britovi]